MGVQLLDSAHATDLSAMIRYFSSDAQSLAIVCAHCDGVCGDTITKGES